MIDLLISAVCSPYVLVFGIIVLGTLLGRIYIKGISLDLSGVLILSIICGVLLSQCDVPILTVSLQGDLRFLSTLGTVLFISGIGISSGYTLSTDILRNGWEYLLAGALIVVNSYLLTIGIAWLDADADRSLLSGVLCGSMTSTPGLSAMSEMDHIDSSLASSGYACSYLFGVMGIVLFVQLVLRKQSVPQQQSKTIVSSANTLSPAAELFQIAVVIAMGCLLGGLQIPILGISLGNAGGVLLVGLLFGAWKRHSRKRQLSQNTLAFLRTLGLLFFFVGSGLPSGAKLLKAFHVKYMLYGVLITSISVLGSYLLQRFLFHKKKTQSLCIVCGGMTSTPAIGILSRKSEERPDLAAYSITYIGALLAMVFGTRLFSI